jgi:hypothetical protein
MGVDDLWENTLGRGMSKILPCSARKSVREGRNCSKDLCLRSYQRSVVICLLSSWCILLKEKSESKIAKERGTEN